MRFTQLKPFLAMVGACLILLVLLNWLTQPRIESNQQAAQVAQLINLAPVGFQDQIQENHLDQFLRSGSLILEDQAKQGCPALTLILTKTTGYSSKLNIVTSIVDHSKQGNSVQGNSAHIHRVRVLPPQYETPGLGDVITIEKSSWISQFNNQTLPATELNSRSDVDDYMAQFDGISGATISTQAVIRGIGKAIQQLQRTQEHCDDIL